MSELLANRANMQDLEAMGVRGVFAYSPLTEEEYSATSGDYFWMPPAEVLTDSEGEPLILATRQVKINPIQSS